MSISKKCDKYRLKPFQKQIYKRLFYKYFRIRFFLFFYEKPNELPGFSGQFGG